MELVVRSPSSPHVRSGGYVGGIGAGGFEPRPDGRFYRCQIFNEWRAERELDAHWIHFNGTDTRVLRLQDLSESVQVQHGVGEIRYSAAFPEVTLRFPERGISLTYRSFFIPGDTPNSTLPAVHVRIRGTGRLLFLMDGRLSGSSRTLKDRAFMMGNHGSLGLWTRGGIPAAIPGWYRIWAAHNTGRNRYPMPRESKPGDTYACLGASWEGRFDDEMIIAWHAPNHRDGDGHLIGHAYANRFRSCEAVLSYVVRNRRKLVSRGDAFGRSIAKAPVPAPVREAYSAQLFSFVKQSWLARDGRFGVWEGSCACCGLQTTDVTYYGSWLYATLFPDLERSGIGLTARFQRKRDGWIPHFFPGTFSRIDEYRRKDMNMQYVLNVYRDALLWNDPAFLKTHYPAVRKAIQGVYAWDRDGDKLPEIEGTAQTFDAWGFSGNASYTSILWLAALRCGMEMGYLAGDREFGGRCAADFMEVRRAIIGKLWNGRWFDLAVKGTRRDPGCLIDALSGDWYCRLMGLGGILPDAMVRSHLRSVLRLNRKRIDHSYMKAYTTPGERGWCYINGGYPDHRRVCFQQFEPWTGTEFSFASHLLSMGMRKEAFRVVKDVQDRKGSCGMNWNHIECGGDYFRPMVIGALWGQLQGGRIRHPR